MATPPEASAGAAGRTLDQGPNWARDAATREESIAPYLQVIVVTAEVNSSSALVRDLATRRLVAHDRSYHVVLDKNPAKSAVRNANRTNEALVFASYLDRPSRTRAAQNQGLWGICQLGSDRVLLSVHPDMIEESAETAFRTALDLLAGGTLAPKEAEIPGLPHLRTALVRGDDREFLIDVERELRETIVFMCSTTKLQRSKIGGFLAVLHYASSEKVLVAIEAVLQESILSLTRLGRVSRVAQPRAKLIPACTCCLSCPL